MPTRREFLQFGASLVWAAQSIDPDRADPVLSPPLHRWFPQFQPARELWVVPFTGDLEEGMLLESAAGLAAHAALHSNWRSLVYEELENAILLHAERLRGYMKLTGVRTLAFNFQRWDSPDSQAACTALASRLPDLEGILAFQYYPYSADNGAIYWVRGARGEEVPVVSCRLCIWAQTGRERETTPAGVAAWLNRMPTLGAAAVPENFSWVLTHAWSRFHAAGAGTPLLAEERDVPQDRDTPDSVRGYTPALWAAERLAPHVKVVTPQEWLLRLRLRLRPQATLRQWFREAETMIRHDPDATEPHRLLAEAGRLLPQTGRDAVAARQCYDHLKAAWRSVPMV